MKSHYEECMRKRTLEGYLVKFDRSPSIPNSDVYAVRIVDSNGIARNYTFFPGVSPEKEPNRFGEIFMNVTAKAQEIWKKVRNNAEEHDAELLRLKQLAAKRKADNLSKWIVLTKAKPTGKNVV